MLHSTTCREGQELPLGEQEGVKWWAGMGGVNTGVLTVSYGAFDYLASTRCEVSTRLPRWWNATASALLSEAVTMMPGCFGWNCTAMTHPRGWGCRW